MRKNDGYSCKRATDTIRITYGIYEFYEFHKGTGDCKEGVFGGIDLRFYFCGDGVDTYLSGVVLGEKEEPEGDVVFGVRFLPGKSLYVDQVSSEELVRSKHTGAPTDFARSMSAGDDLYTKTVLFMRMYEKRFITRTSRVEFLNDALDIDHYVRRRLLETKGAISIREITSETGYSDCYLRRIFSGIHSCPPKTFGQFVRLQHAMELLYSRSGTLDEVASECGYYDQSHMNKDFRKFLGCTPEGFSQGRELNSLSSGE